MADDIEERVIQKIRERKAVGLKKYGVGMERGDLSLAEWIAHLQAELMDAAVYAEKVLAGPTEIGSVPSLAWDIKGDKRSSKAAAALASHYLKLHTLAKEIVRMADENSFQATRDGWDVIRKLEEEVGQ